MRIAGRWQITEAELWDSDALNLVAPAFIEFAEDGSGSFGFIAVQGEMAPDTALIPASSLSPTHLVHHSPFGEKDLPAERAAFHGRPQGLTQRPGMATRWPAQVPASP